MIPNSYTLEGIFNPHLATIIDSYILAYLIGKNQWFSYWVENLTFYHIILPRAGCKKRKIYHVWSVDCDVNLQACQTRGHIFLSAPHPHERFLKFMLYISYSSNSNYSSLSLDPTFYLSMQMLSNIQSGSCCLISIQVDCSLLDYKVYSRFFKLFEIAQWWGEMTSVVHWHFPCL